LLDPGNLQAANKAIIELESFVFQVESLSLSGFFIAGAVV
jgi:hypothetical protein